MCVNIFLQKFKWFIPLLGLLSTSLFASVSESDIHQATFSYESGNFCHLHYKVNGGTQMNVVMDNMGEGKFQYIVDGLKAGDKIDYFYTYESAGLAYDTAWYTHQFNGSDSGDSGGDSDLVSYPGYTGNYVGYTLIYDERFDHFNSSVWKKGDGSFGETDCRFTDNAVEVSEGVLNISIRPEHVPASWSQDQNQWRGAENFSCGELRLIDSKKIRYGRFEVRMKSPARNTASGYISSFFTYTNGYPGGEWEELDFEFEGMRPDKFQANYIYGLDTWEWWRTREWGAWEDKITVGAVDNWRVYALEWTPTYVKWYVDGVLYKTMKQEQLDCNPCQAPQVHHTPIPDNLTSLMANFWIPSDAVQNTFGGNKSGNVYPLVTQYDWIRIYQLDSEPFTSW